MKLGSLRGRTNESEQPVSSGGAAAPTARQVPPTGAHKGTGEPSTLEENGSGLGETARERRDYIPPAGSRVRAGEARGRSRSLWGRRARARDAGAATVGALGSGVLGLARLVMAIASLIALLIALAIVLRDVDANSANTIVKDIHEGANFFAGAFTGLITFSGHPKRAITVDWGIALLVYLLVGALLARWIGGIGRRGLRFERRHRTATSP